MALDARVAWMAAAMSSGGARTYLANLAAGDIVDLEYFKQDEADVVYSAAVRVLEVPAPRVTGALRGTQQQPSANAAHPATAQ